MKPLQPKDMSHQPLYLQIKEALKRQILAGEYAPYQRMPSESELMKSFGVSRITVRQALRDLHSEGLIFSAQGKGTFASKPKATQDIKHLQGFDEAMKPQGYETSARLVSIRETVVSKNVQENLGLTAKERVVEVVRVRYLNREPVSVDSSYFPMAIGTALFSKDLSQDIFPMLENQLGIELGEAEISLEARPADADVAKFLKIEPGSPIMWVERLTRDSTGQPIDFEYLAFRGDSYKYRFQIQRDPLKNAPIQEDK
ncbi:GntR family transcriptional regulator [Microbulbifer rhizosphaerae]|uniref:GntR family transcriptional regulator n=1 Tax=Microbulbifer rhizosphaerae TaxID=1562603 RepID=A0A7W4Z925_9GAMM|nr:GntR family transcriptional regulator [Microbulbifer rhizosphaerae]MBB3061151.1 GntR family transcriptional regulator [Microbulbifer rhizosphaerae]